MRLTPHEIEKTNVLTAVCNIAQRRLASGLRLNLPEAEGLIAGQMIHLARSGNHTVAQIMNIGRNFLGRKQVLAGKSNLNIYLLLTILRLGFTSLPSCKVSLKCWKKSRYDFLHMLYYYTTFTSKS